MSRSRRVARNVLSMTLTQIVTWGLTTFVMIYLPAYAGDVGLGRLTLADSLAAVSGLFVYLGTSNVVVRDVARARERSGDYLTAVLMQRALLGVAVGAVAALLVPLSGYPEQTRMLITLSTGCAVLASLSVGVGDVLRGQEKIPRQNVAALAEKVVYAITVLLAIRAGAPLWAVAACAGVGTLVGLAVNLTAFPEGIPRPRKAHWLLAGQIALAGAPFFANTLFVTLYTYCYPIILQRLCGDAVVGWYGLVTRLFGTALFLPTILSGAMLPAITRLRAENPAGFPDAVGRMVRLMVLCAAPIASVIIFLPAQIIQLLHYPPGFRNAVPVFVLFGIGLALWYLSIPIGTAITALDRQRELSRASALAAAAVVPLGICCVWMAQRGMGNGAVGAALSHVLIEAYLLGRYLRALPEGLLPAASLARLVLKTTVAALPMGLFSYLLRGEFGLLALLPGFALYAQICLWTGCITPQDLQILRGAVLPGRRAAAT